MEFPDLGKHCSEPSCKQLDFLPVKCDACEKIFCHEHMKYASHNCDSSYKKDVQVPVCPLCSTPIPVARGEQPDIAVSAHIDSQCQSDPAKVRRKTFSNKCSMKGCKTKELIPCVCKECRLNFCLKHRHTSDHRCAGRQATRDSAMKAALNRMGGNNNGVSLRSQTTIADVQGGMSEDEALARAIQLSMQTSNGEGSTYEQDRQLALMLSQSQSQTQESGTRSHRSLDRCSLS